MFISSSPKYLLTGNVQSNTKAEKIDFTTIPGPAEHFPINWGMGYQAGKTKTVAENWGQQTKLFHFDIDNGLKAYFWK